jgi:hypothetical protein
LEELLTALGVEVRQGLLPKILPPQKAAQPP